MIADTPSNRLVEDDLARLNKALAEILKSEVVSYLGPIEIGVDDAFRREIEAIKSAFPKNNRLTVVLETTGGYIEVCERIYNVLRKNYDLCDFVVPNFAYSAGTILALSGDNIYMDYYSVLGPIDPQISTSDDKMVPGLGYLAKYKELTEKINADTTGSHTRAELAYLLKKFDPAELFTWRRQKSTAKICSKTGYLNTSLKTGRKPKQLKPQWMTPCVVSEREK